MYEFAAPIDFAIEYAIKQFENTKNDNERLIFEALKRSQLMWLNIKTHGLESYGLTYEQFCKQCEEKNNIIFLSDTEMIEFNKVKHIIDIMKRENIHI